MFDHFSDNLEEMKALMKARTERNYKESQLILRDDDPNKALAAYMCEFLRKMMADDEDYTSFVETMYGYDTGTESEKGNKSVCTCPFLH